MRNRGLARVAAVLMLAAVGVPLAACSNTTAVRTTDTKLPKTDWRQVHVLTVRPERAFEEIGSLNSSGWKAKKTEDMYKERRQNAAKFGADDVLITESGVSGRDDEQWVRAAAIRYTSAP